MISRVSTKVTLPYESDKSSDSMESISQWDTQKISASAQVNLDGIELSRRPPSILFLQ